MKPFSRFIFIILCFIWQAFSLPLSAQLSGFLEGKVFNSVTSEPVPFASIMLKDNRLNVYSNTEGDFSLLQNSAFQSDSAIITCIGFKKYLVAFKNFSQNELNIIYLTRAQNEPEEVKVADQEKKLNPVAIIRKAISNIRVGYYSKPVNYISYYRDFQKHDTSYLNLNEAIIETFDNGFTPGSVTKINRLLDFRKNMDFPRKKFTPEPRSIDSIDLHFKDKLIMESVWNYQYTSEFSALMALDPIRNFNTRSFSFIETFSENFIDNHNFSPPAEVYNDNLLLLKITFNAKTRIIGDSLMVSGAIYIRPEDYSIHKLEYSCYSSNKGKGLKKLLNFDVEYGYDATADSLMRLKYISLGKLFNVIDTDDKSYFRLLNIGWDFTSNINPTLALSFNNKVDADIASQKKNYIIKIGNNIIKINNIQVTGENIYIRFKNDDIKGLADSCEVYTQVLKDVNGNSLDKRKSMEIYQYRELFVQEYNNPVNLQDSCLVKRRDKYWMNSPDTYLRRSSEKPVNPDFEE
jgi:CarboxypepD_reg-like domain